MSLAARESRVDPAPSLITVMARWMPLEVVVTVLAMLAYATVQQAHRQGANDPQIQAAEDAARALAGGAAPRAVVGATPVDLAVSLAAWTTVFDGANRVLASNAALDGRTPAPPPGVLESARAEGENRVTWEPRSGVRSATVSAAVRGGSRMVVTVGRSLREVEVREGRLELFVVAAWLAASLGSLIAVALGEWLVRR